MNRILDAEIVPDGTDRGVSSDRAEGLAPCLCVTGRAVFQRKRLWRGLEQTGYRVRRFSGSQSLLAEVKATAPDVIICEVPASVEPVFELLSRLADLECDACVILIGPEIGADLVARCLRDGAFDYLTVAAASQVQDALRRGLANRQVFRTVRNMSGQLVLANAALAGERDALQQWNRNLSMLNALTQTLAASLISEAIVRSFFDCLAGLVAADVIGVGRPDPSSVWTWSRSAAYARQEQRVRQHLLSRFTAHAAPVSQSGAQTMRLPSGIQETRRTAPVPATWQPMLLADRAAMTIPLAIMPDRQGVLYVERKQGMFSESDLQLLSMAGASLSLALHNATLYQQMQEQALRDGLTGLLNRRALEEVLERELKEASRYRASACLIMIDLDYFKRVNDLLGHMAGDEVLRTMAALMQYLVRDTDTVGRYGGEEFGIVLPHTGLDRAVALAERLREQIERHEFGVDGGLVRTTVSLGIAQIEGGTFRTVPDWIAAADAALYEAKRTGRNRVVLYGADGACPAATALDAMAA
ncbi:MAG: diguanylate cyclase [Nitrospira sp.]|nr:diguanylate cyclase [Nitrospira sp.]